MLPIYFNHVDTGENGTHGLENEIFLLCFLSDAFTALISALLFHENQRLFSGLKCGMLKSFIRNYAADY